MDGAAQRVAEAPADSTGLAPADSAGLALADSAGFALADSAGFALADSAGLALPESIRAAAMPPLPIPWMEPGALDPLWPGGSLGLNVWTSSPGHEIVESLEREFLVPRQTSGSVVATPERLWRTGPGWENWSLLDDGMPMEDPSSPFPQLLRWSPAWIRSITWLPYDPVLAPLASGASGVVWVETLSRPAGTPSAVRLTTGNYDVSSEEALVERDFLGNRLGFYYGDFRSVGRDVIGSNKGQNILFRVAHPFGRTLVRAEWGSRFSQVKWTQGRKLRWEESTVRGRSSSSLGEDAVLETRAQVFHQLWRWRGLEGVTRRRDKGLDVSAQGSLFPDSTRRFVGAARVVFAERSWEIPGGRKDNSDEMGMALALGWRRALHASRLRLSAGLELRELKEKRVYPVVSAGYRLQRGRWHIRADAWSAIEVASALAAANDYETLLLRGAPEELGGATSHQRLHHAEAGVGVTTGDGMSPGSPRGGPMAELAILYEDRREARALGGSSVSGDSVDAQFSSSASALAPTRARVAIEGRARLLLPLGFWTEARGSWLLLPTEPTDRTWLPELSGVAILGTSFSLFGGDILLDGRLTWTGRSRWSTPFGDLSWDDNLDAEIRGWVGEAAVFAILRNVEDDIRASSSYDDGWIPRPRRNGAVGVTWRFSN